MRHGLLAVLCGITLALTAACGGSDGPTGPEGAGTGTRPLADAGPARSVVRGSTVTLDGSASRDPGGAALRYTWTLQSRPAGSVAALSSTSIANPSFVPDLVGDYTVALVVANATVSSTQATVAITALTDSAVPSARAGGAQSVLQGATVQLDGAGSTDPDGDALSYDWVLIAQPAGSTAALSSTNSPKPTFVADTAGSYTAKLVVSDGVNTSLPSLVTVNAAQGNVAPVARAGVDRGAIPGSTVALDGTDSSDANSDPLTFDWTLASKPAGSLAALSTASSDRSSFVADQPGSYVATLVVRDGALDSAPSSVTITVSAANLPPVAHAGPAQTVAVGSRVLLDGRSSSDANGDALSYQWSLTSRPAGSTAALLVRTDPGTDFVADVEGIYIASLVVNDGKADSAGSTVTVTAIVIVPALAPGAGSFAQQPAALPFVQIDGTTGATDVKAPSCAIYSAADLMPDGVVLAASSTASTLTQVDVVTGRCKVLFRVAEPMAAIAVSAGGVVHLLSEASTGGARQLYRYAADGALLSQRPVSGISGTLGVAHLTSPQGMDFAPDGTLYVSQQDAIWQLDPTTGVATLRASAIDTRGDFDIDAAGLMRTISAGRLNVYRASGWVLDRSLPLQGASLGAAPLVHR